MTRTLVSDRELKDNFRDEFLANELFNPDRTEGDEVYTGVYAKEKSCLLNTDNCLNSGA